MDRLGLAVQPILTVTDSALAVLSTRILRKYGRRGQLLAFLDCAALLGGLTAFLDCAAPLGGLTRECVAALLLPGRSYHNTKQKRRHSL